VIAGEGRGWAGDHEQQQQRMRREIAIPSGPTPKKEIEKNHVTFTPRYINIQVAPVNDDKGQRKD